MLIDRPIVIDFHRKSILIGLTTFFLYRFLSSGIEIDVNRRMISIAIVCYRLSVYRLTMPGSLHSQESHLRVLNVA